MPRDSPFDYSSLNIKVQFYVPVLIIYQVSLVEFAFECSMGEFSLSVSKRYLLRTLVGFQDFMNTRTNLFAKLSKDRVKNTIRILCGMFSMYKIAPLVYSCYSRKST